LTLRNITYTIFGVKISIPRHTGDIPNGTARAILRDAENNGEVIPAASSQKDIAKMCVSQNQMVTMVVADTDEYRRQHDTRSVKKTLSIPSWLNHKAEIANAPFSQILQQGLKEYLHIAQ